MTRLVQMFGTPVVTPIRGLNCLFPRPEVLAIVDLSKVGIPEAQAAAIRKLASSTSRGHFSFATSRTAEQTVSQVVAVCGLDESTANYIAMRAYGEPDAFPAHEFRIRRRLAESGPVPRSAQALTMAERWRPWRAYAAMHLAH